MIYFIILISILLFALTPQGLVSQYGVSTTHLYEAFGYMLLHISWLHLIINSVSLLMLWIPIRRIYSTHYNTNAIGLAASVYWAAVIAGAVCATDIPTVGMSGCVFFLLGVLLILNPTRKQALNYIWVALAVLVQIIFGKSNVPLHLFAFTEGIVYMCLREFAHQYANKTGLFGVKEE